MAYENDFDNYSESSLDGDRDFGSFDSNGLFLRDDLLLSGVEQSGEVPSSSEAGENSEYNTDYSDILGSIDSNCSLSVEQTESLMVQLDNLNNNLVTLNENLKVGVGFIFVITFVICFKVAFNILFKVLGLGQA